VISHKKLSNWYHQLSGQLDAGIPLGEAIHASGGPGAKHRKALADAIASGKALRSVLDEAPPWLPRADRVFILAGAESGTLPATLARLGERHDRIHANRRKVVFGLLYPLAVFHVAALILPVVSMIDFESGFEWDQTRHALATAALLGPLWSLIGLVVLMAKIESPLLPALLRGIPILRTYARTQALADLAHMLGALVKVGVSVPEAWRTTARIQSDPRIRRAVEAMEPIFQAGGDPAAELPKYRCFPADFTAFYQSGARTGKLDETLATAAARQQERADRAMTTAAIVYPALVLVLVAAFLIVNIFAIYARYLKSFESFL